MIRRALGVLLLLGVVGGSGHAQQRDEPLRFRVSDPNQVLYRLAVGGVIGFGDLRSVADTLASDLAMAGLFKLLDPSSYPPGLASELPQNTNVTDWSQVGAQGVIKAKVSGKQVEFWLWEVSKGNFPALQKVYADEDLRHATHRFANEVVRYFTGEDGIFDSRIAFAAGRGSDLEIYSVDFDGSNQRRVSSMGATSILPRWSPRGNELAFTSFLRGNPDLWIVSSGGGRARRVSKWPGLNSGASFSPDGGKIALTLSKDGNAEIYVLRSDGSILSRLTNDPGIDTSPTWSPDGSQIAFVSNRRGTPQIWTMSASGGGQARLTYQGGYNTTPAWSPKAERPLVAFTGRDEKNRFDIFVIDPRSKEVGRVTQGQGSNESPTWSPDGRLLAYTSSRGGLWVMNLQTRYERQIYSRTARDPSWGPRGSR